MCNDIYLLIGKNIQKNRQKKGYSLKDLSLMTNISIKDLEKLEQEGTNENTNLETLNNIALKLNIKIVDLFQETTDK